MFRTVIWFIYLALICILSTPPLLVKRLFVKKENDRQRYQNWAAQKLLIPLEKIAGFRLEAEGYENMPDGPALYAGNHQGFFDIFIILKHLGKLKPVVAKAETKKIPVVSTWMKSFDCIFIDRSNPRKGLEAINEAQRLLESGRSVVIFPEGTRSRGHEMNEFKSGALRCAIKAGVPVVPFVIDETWKGFEERMRIHPVTATLTILPPIQTSGEEKPTSKELGEKLQSLIQAELDKKATTKAEP